MNLAPSPKPLMLTPKDEEILKVINTYRFVTTLDIAHLLYRPTYLPYVRKRLSRLAGGKDLQPDTYLVRFWLPSSVGNRERIFTLGEKGRAFLREVAGLTVDWRFQIAKFKFFSFSNILHNLLLTRFLIACHVWARGNSVTILQERTSYELSQTPLKVALPDKKTLTVIPDAWLFFETADGKYAVLFELDRGMEHGEKFKQHVKGRIELIRSGKYKETFGVPAVIVAYLTTGQTPEYRNTRVKTMNTWTREVLAESNRVASWGSIFRFTAVEFDSLYESISSIFDQPVWLRPDTKDLVRLFG